MADASTVALEERILLLAPTKRDAAAAEQLFDPVGLAVTLCEELSEVCAEIERGAAVAIVPDEAILADKERCLSRLLHEQPPWSDFPLIVMTPPQQTKAAAHELEAVGHMTLMRRPVEIHSLTSTILAAL